MSGASLIFWKNIDLLYKAIEALRKVGADEDFFRDIAKIEEIAEKVVDFVHNSENHAIYELEIGEDCEGALIAPMDLDASYKALIALRNKGADKKFFEKIAERKDLAHEVVDFLHRSVNNVVYELEVDYNYCLGEMVEAGRYELADKSIKACHFLVKGRGAQVVKAVLLHFNSDKEKTTLEEARNAAESENCRFATIEELLAFGRTYPNIQKRFPIVAVGSMWKNPDNGIRYVPALWADENHDRCVYLCPCGRGWGKNYRFLAIRN